MNIFIITGLSGSGKRTAAAVFEDSGFYCVDNMPVALLPGFVDLPVENVSKTECLAFVMDLRDKGFLPGYKFVFESLRQKGHRLEILFLEADEKILLQRYSQTRRCHPLPQAKNVPDGISTEQHLFEDLKKAASMTIDTSGYNVHELKSVILEIVQKDRKSVPMQINVMSFGFKFGVPHDADLIMDVRFLANPYFDPGLKAFDGEAPEIREYVLNRDDARIFLDKFLDMIDYLIPLYEKEGKAYLTIAVGCTGGRHRSVAVVRTLFGHIDKPGRRVSITHRDIGQ